VIVRWLIAIALAVGTLWGEEAQPVALSPVTRDEVRQAVAGELRQRGLSEAQLPRSDDIDLASTIAAPPRRRLRISSIGWDASQGRAEFRIECSEPGQCVPFLAYVRIERTLFPELRRPGLNSPTRKPARPAPAVRTGDRATVVFVGERLRLAVQVTCLERGAEGEVIRVRNQDGHVFRARVSGPALLEALSQ
jgi:Chaperone for flagella basal body P-ring formation